MSCKLRKILRDIFFARHFFRLRQLKFLSHGMEVFVKFVPVLYAAIKRHFQMIKVFVPLLRNEELFNPSRANIFVCINVSILSRTLQCLPQNTRKQQGILVQNELMIMLYIASEVYVFGVFLVRISHIRTENRELLRISPYTVQLRECTDKKNSEYRHFSRSAKQRRIQNPVEHL